ncbi:MAG: glutathione S-transferase N-terminal domain-containing protein, partial [Myxococcales bacterium]|nr:glutathione S-transferase N-terminal domain-containing protein [Myxococcales bacterium]
MSEIILYEIVLSPFCEKVRRALNFKGIEYRRVECITWTNGRIKAMNPRRKFPFMDYRGTMLLDSTDILHAIEHDFPEPALVPTDENRRARTHLLEDWADESLFWYEVWFRFFPPETSRRIAGIVAAELPPWVRPLIMKLVPWMVRRQAVAQGVGRKPRNVLEAEMRRHY